MAGLRRYVAAPKVVSKYVAHRRSAGVHVFVAHDSFTVVKHEVSPATVDVAEQGEGCYHEAADQPMPHEGWQQFVWRVLQLRSHSLHHCTEKGRAVLRVNWRTQKVGGAGAREVCKLESLPAWLNVSVYSTKRITADMRRLRTLFRGPASPHRVCA